MRSVTTSALSLAATALVLGALLPTALAHGDEGADMDMDMDMGGGMDMSADQPLPDDQYPPTYFSHSEHRGVLLAHIGLMILGWVVMLPLGELGGRVGTRRAPASWVRLWTNQAKSMRQQPCSPLRVPDTPCRRSSSSSRPMPWASFLAPFTTPTRPTYIRTMPTTSWDGL